MPAVDLRDNHQVLNPSAPELSWRGAVRHGAALGLSVIGAAQAYGMARVIHAQGDLGFDAHAYWVAGRAEGNLYTRVPGQRDAFNYAPIVADWFSVLAWMSWSTFWAAWTIGTLGLFWWLLRPLGWIWGPPFFFFICFREVVLGNIFAVMAVALVLAIRRPSAGNAGALGIVLLLTKVTPALAIMWFVGRRQWRGASWAAATPLLLAGASAAHSPERWRSWVSYLFANGDGVAIGLLWRLSIATALVVVAAWANKPWLVAFALMLALPWIGGSSVLAVLAALPRLIRREDLGAWVRLRRTRSSSATDSSRSLRPTVGAR